MKEFVFIALPHGDAKISPVPKDLCRPKKWPRRNGQKILNEVGEEMGNPFRSRLAFLPMADGSGAYNRYLGWAEYGQCCDL